VGEISAGAILGALANLVMLSPVLYWRLFNVVGLGLCLSTLRFLRVAWEWSTDVPIVLLDQINGRRAYLSFG